MSKDRVLGLLRQAKLFSGFTAKELRTVTELFPMEHRVYKRGERMAAEGEVVSRIGLIVHGEAVMRGVRNESDAHIPRWYGTGDAIGAEVVFTRKKTMPHAVYARRKAEVLWMPCDDPDDFLRLGEAPYAKLVKAFLQVVSEDAMHYLFRGDILAPNTVQDRILEYLRVSTAKTKSFKKLSRQEQADFLCVVRQSLSRAIAKMREEGTLPPDLFD
jgi:CRP-like cAMP-binding protein